MQFILGACTSQKAQGWLLGYNGEMTPSDDLKEPKKMGRISPERWQEWSNVEMERSESIPETERKKKNYCKVQVQQVEGKRMNMEKQVRADVVSTLKGSCGG